MQEIVHPKGKVYYTMGEVSEMFDVKPSLLRYWEQEFDLLSPQRNKKGNRLYTPQDVDNIKVIYHLLKERGMKIEAARKYMKTKPSGAGRDAEIMERLLGVRALLVEIRSSLSHGGDFVEEVQVHDLGEREPNFEGQDTAKFGTQKPVGFDEKKPVQAEAVKFEQAEEAKHAPAVGAKVVTAEETGPVPAKETGPVPAEENRVEYFEHQEFEPQPPFEEQRLFELIPPREFESVDEAMDAFISKHYDAQADENTPPADPFAPFAGEEISADVSAKPAEAAQKRPLVIEQTLF